tara:strand:+ start:54 stop:1067 length:1014 start_codon:yes stop_codon:yes gene_type:complete
MLPESVAAEADKVPRESIYAYSVNRQSLILSHPDCIQQFNLPENFRFLVVTRPDAVLDRLFTPTMRDMRGIPTLPALTTTNAAKYLKRRFRDGRENRAKYCRFVYRYRLLESIMRGCIIEFIDYMNKSGTFFARKAALRRYKQTLDICELDFYGPQILAYLLSFDPSCPSKPFIICSYGGFPHPDATVHRKLPLLDFARGFDLNTVEKVAATEVSRKRKREEEADKYTVKESDDSVPSAKRVKVEDSAENAPKKLAPIHINVSLSSVVKPEAAAAAHRLDAYELHTTTGILKAETERLKKIRDNLVQTIIHSRNMVTAARETDEKIAELFVRKNVSL